MNHTESWLISAWPPTETPTSALCTTNPLVSVSEYPEAIGRVLPSELLCDPLAVLPQSPVSAERPALRMAEPNCTQPTPTCVKGDMCTLSSHEVIVGERVAGFNITLEGVATIPISRVPNLFTGSAVRVSTFWHACRRTAAVRNAVAALLNDGGIRLERRKRMGICVAAEHKRAVRAQRNRERSHALRRHHKRRLALLERATAALHIQNTALRALALVAAKLAGRTQALADAMRTVGGTELVAYLGVHSTTT